MCKDVFIDWYKYWNVVEDWNDFLTRIEDLKLHILELEKNNAMKPKIYLFDEIIEKDDRRPITVISHDECIFSANNGIQRVWSRIENTFLRLKSCRHDIMTSHNDFRIFTSLWSTHFSLFESWKKRRSSWKM